MILNSPDGKSNIQTPSRRVWTSENLVAWEAVPDPDDCNFVSCERRGVGAGMRMVKGGAFVMTMMIQFD